MMPDNEILKIIAPDVKVLIWVDNQSLGLKTPYFSTVNYLLDGLVRKHIDEKKDWEQVTFVHTLFGQSFWVAFANTNEIKINDFTQSLKSIIPEGERSKMILLNHKELPQDWNQTLDKLFGFIERV